MNYTGDDPLVIKFTNQSKTPTKNEQKRIKKDDKKTQPKSFWLRHLIEFFRTTALHGYKYLAMEDTPTYERWFWGIAVSICLASVTVLVWIAWGWNQNNPTLTVIESTHYQTWNYPFPAVTICSLNKASKSLTKIMSEKLKIPPKYNMSTDEVFDHMKYVTVIYGNVPMTDEISGKMTVFQDILDYNNVTVNKLMKRITPNCTSMLENCSWKATKYRCETIFQDIVSSEGICCTFNFYGIRSTSQQYKLNQSPKPRRVASCGPHSALSLLLKISTKNFYSSTFGSYGMRVYVHEPYDFPDENTAAKLVPPKSEAFIELSPEMTYATDSIKAMEVGKRRCVFSTEWKSSVFTKYTYTNCLAECRSKIVLNRCGCVPIFLPNIDKKRICNFMDVSCVSQAREFYSNSLPEVNVTCNCLPNCERNSYPMEISVGAFSIMTVNKTNENYVNKPFANRSLLHVYFNDLVGTRFRMDIYLTWYNLLASFGGLLGLFIGFSLVSGFELIYFFTVRFFFDMLHKNKPNKDVEMKDNTTNSQLFNRWVEKHNIKELKPPNQIRPDDDSQMRGGVRKNSFFSNRQRF